MAEYFEAYSSGSEPVGSYEELLELGRGGMGTAYLARAVGEGGFERLVVIKRLHRHLTDKKDSVKRFLDEAIMAAAIRHANVVGTHHVGKDGDGYFLVLDYVEGASLEELFDYAALKKKNIPPPIVLRIALDALAGLQAVHEAEDASGRLLKILHRDVTLQNVLIGRDGLARIADFGIAKSAFGSVVTDQMYVVGKLLYMPPEYLRRQPTGPSLDVYSLGVTLWLALSGTELWGDATEGELARHVSEDAVPRLSSVIQIPPQIDDLVARATAHNPAERFQTAREMAEAIETIGRETGWVTSHGEVARYLNELVGPELRRRRERVAKLLSQRDAIATTEVRRLDDRLPERKRSKESHALRPTAEDSSALRYPNGMLSPPESPGPAVYRTGEHELIAADPAGEQQRIRTSVVALIGIFTLLLAAVWFWARTERTRAQSAAEPSQLGPRSAAAAPTPSGVPRSR